MPLNTQIIRGREELGLRWSHFHLEAMTIAVAIDSGEGPWEVNTKAGIFPADPDWPIVIGPPFLVNYLSIGATPLNNGEYVLRGGPYTFIDATDGEEFEMRPGDKLVAYRTSKF